MLNLSHMFVSAAVAIAAVLFFPITLPLVGLAYIVVWLYSWRKDINVKNKGIHKLPFNPIKVYKRALALMVAVRDGYGGPTLPIIFSYMASKILRRIKQPDTMVNDIRYGPSSRHRLDMYVPVASAYINNGESPSLSSESSTGSGGSIGQSSTATVKSTCPVIVICPGYQWSGTNHTRLYWPMAQNLCNDGYFVILPRLGTKGKFSLVETLRDLQLVVDWVHSQIPPAGGDADQVYLLGAGAGAHLCSLYNLGCALGSQYAQACKQMGRSTIPILSSPEADRMLKIWCTSLRNPPRPVLGLILISGVFDLMFQKRYEDERCLSGLAMTSYLFDSRAKAEAWSPQVILDSLKRRNFVLDISKMAKRALFIHGRKDATFPFLSSHRFFRSLCNWDVPDVNMKVYANLRRIDPTVALLSPKAPLTQSLLEDIRGIILDLDQEKGEEGSP